MNDLSIFFNTRVELSGRHRPLTWIGDKGLAPFRYLFNGSTIRIQPRDNGAEIEVHHVASFHESGRMKWSNTSVELRSSPTGMIKTLLSIVFLVPGFFLGSFIKGLAYLSAEVREDHRLTKEHFTPVDREIGSASDPIKTEKKLFELLQAEELADPKNHLTNALIIHGDGSLTINEGLGIFEFNPMKLVLEGATIIHEPASKLSLDNVMFQSGEWEASASRFVPQTLVKVHKVTSINEALQATAPRLSWFSFERYHMIFSLTRS